MFEFTNKNITTTKKSAWLQALPFNDPNVKELDENKDD